MEGKQIIMEATMMLILKIKGQAFVNSLLSFGMVRIETGKVIYYKFVREEIKF